MHRKVATALVAALGIWLAGCGGGESESLTKNGFAKQANAICKDASKATDKLLADASKEAKAAGQDQLPPDEIAALMKRALGITQQALEDLNGLKPPSAMQARYERYTDLQAERLKLFEQQVEAAGQEKPLSPAAQKRADKLGHDSIEMRDKLGLDSCTQF